LFTSFVAGGLLGTASGGAAGPGMAPLKLTV